MRSWELIELLSWRDLKGAQNTWKPKGLAMGKYGPGWNESDWVVCVTNENQWSECRLHSSSCHWRITPKVSRSLFFGNRVGGCRGYKEVAPVRTCIGICIYMTGSKYSKYFYNMVQLILINNNWKSMLGKPLRLCWISESVTKGSSMKQTRWSHDGELSTAFVLVFEHNIFVLPHPGILV